ncbi:MAG: NAD(P)/FAD-dependent oxidoreductase [Coriobacteriia bacterium]|nr:NAD(P)/FAD-dependent oxidoreductase [Coriobacteriia bacterium]
MYDITIVGAGPAGLSAAITARARNKSVLVVSNRLENSPLAKAKIIDNYPGVSKISGRALLEQMQEQALGLGVEFCFERVISVLPLGERFSLTAGDRLIEARSIILATGVSADAPFPGESEFLGRGVSYCATCDGMLYRTAKVCVVGLDAEAVTEANFLAEIGADVSFLARKAPTGLSEGIAVKLGSVINITGDMMGVTGLTYREADTDKTESITCAGIFILRPTLAPDTLLAGLELKENSIIVDRGMSTNIPGVFAAGDCTGKPLQIAKAVGEGQLACFSAIESLGWYQGKPDTTQGTSK